MTQDIELTAFEGGATRSKQSVRYDLIPPVSLKALATRLSLGAEKHGERNWESGGEEFRQATISHLMAHLIDYMENGNTNEANTDAIICNAAFLCFYEDKMPFKKSEHTPETP